MDRVKDEPYSRLFAVFRRHPALLVSAFYVAASVIGMFYAWSYLRQFGLNVFNYAQISDFLVASLKEPFTWALVFLSVSLVMLDNLTSLRVERKGPKKWLRWYGSPRYRFVNNYVAVIMVMLFIFLYAEYKAGKTQAGEGKFVDVTYADGDAATSRMLLGTTGQFVFLYDHVTERVEIHPLESIDSIAFQAD
ncbi:MAG: hypothetical protein QNJ14_13655 [Woeseiaceae bacterium]|nr:hypothetical protein [Woeseiaceae bacterium]